MGQLWGEREGEKQVISTRGHRKTNPSRIWLMNTGLGTKIWSLKYFKLGYVSHDRSFFGTMSPCWWGSNGWNNQLCTLNAYDDGVLEHINLSRLHLEWFISQQWGHKRTSLVSITNKYAWNLEHFVIFWWTLEKQKAAVSCIEEKPYGCNWHSLAGIGIDGILSWANCPLGALVFAFPRILVVFVR